MCAKYLFMLCLLAYAAEAQKVFNVKDYGAIQDGNTDNSVAFVTAWSDACKWNGVATVLIPNGTYMLKSVIFNGPCNGSITFEINGVLKAPIDPSMLADQKWINFRYVDKLTINGGGTFDGQGTATRQKCQNDSCQILFTTMVLDFITNGRIENLHSADSKGGHFIVFGSGNITFTNLTLTSPANNRNTDGIKTSHTNGINITNVKIGTGDDCIAMISGTKNVRIKNVFCGPGHGISVGSLGGGGNPPDLPVEDVVVKNCTFNSSINGVQIKTWPFPLKTPLSVSNFIYEDIVMINVKNPIFINQQYCPKHNCDLTKSSHVQISNVSYKNIRGSSATDIAVNLNCSMELPCQNVTVEDIDLSSSGRDGRQHIKNYCSHVKGFSYGKQIPPSCLPNNKFRTTPLPY
ncbi:exopolygalacturonase-like [Vigna radiata var. radiata]|uniref:Exopolygalacturonase-like n=1 Tax=Vigna radiata var. radiata TaxID=3916 RepID=A0A3Q0EXU0_VIGRR|nr:exopolygalacturonase-like [Vigna radiata var. radiata]